ncbi:MAG TPA: response regulator transcription factor [Baekduia sp.]|uniref:response regulator transcription factor n=1 Tax=Baekduia sp. TaxID=2600305 RepID=UPI002CFDC330|nr:response regulator transcription factor [Baekduia sp.]HMJ37777.1 response regulator transcription factor [Baekduia sp.]
MRVLVVEDEADLADAVARGLREWGMAVDVAPDGDAALLSLGVHDYEVVVLDRDLPGISGDEVCRRIVAGAQRPRILMLTAAVRADDVVDGFALGADDYLRKPFDFGELVARVTALARRQGRPGSPLLQRGDLTLDPLAREARRGGRDLRLTPKELAVLRVLLEAQGAIVSQEELLVRAWDEHANPFSNAMRMVVMALRRKVGEPPVIETVRGFGYRIP